MADPLAAAPAGDAHDERRADPLAAPADDAHGERRAGAGEESIELADATMTRRPQLPAGDARGERGSGEEPVEHADTNVTRQTTGETPYIERVASAFSDFQAALEARRWGDTIDRRWGDTLDLASPSADAEAARRTTSAQPTMDELKKLFLSCNAQCRRALLALTLAIALVSVGVVAYEVVQGGEVLTALYVIVQVVTTIGYGDITPKSDGVKVFTMIYIVCLLVVVAKVVNVASVWLLHRATEVQQELMRDEEEAVLKLLGSRYTWVMRLFRSTVQFCAVVLVGAYFFRSFEQCECGYGETWVGNPDCPEGELIGFWDCEDAGGQVKDNYVTALYFSVTTVTTVGFGDLTPMSRFGRAFGILWMLVGVLSTAVFVSGMSRFLFVEEDHVREEDCLAMDQALFHAIDRDGNGFLARDEYYEYVLTKHGLVTQEIIDVLRKRFDSFEGDDDKATWAQVKAARVQRTGRRIARALRRSIYVGIEKRTRLRASQ